MRRDWYFLLFAIPCVLAMPRYASAEPLSCERDAVVPIRLDNEPITPVASHFTLSGHVAAMAPGTRIGAAHPVQIGSSPLTPNETPGSPQRDPPGTNESGESKDTTSPMEEKIVNDAMAWARSLAELRNGNVEWVVLAVSESRSITAAEAVREGVVDLQAAELLRLIDGRDVSVRSAEGAQQSVRLDLAHAPIRTLEMWWGERLAVVANPNVALVLIGAENNTTIVFPVPLELANTFLSRTPVTSGTPGNNERQAG